LIHASAANERQGRRLEHNERMEFLGDAVLQLVVSGYFYDHYPKMAEGDMTKMRASVVNEQVLAQVAAKLSLGDYLRLGRGEEMSGGRERPSILSDALEALIGAMFLDVGLGRVQEFILEQLAGPLDAVEKGEYRQDFKTSLQEWMQRETGRNVQYRTVEQKGPDHAKVFTVQVECEGEVWALDLAEQKKMRNNRPPKRH
jgi:ribonuclease III